MRQCFGNIEVIFRLKLVWYNWQCVVVEERITSTKLKNQMSVRKVQDHQCRKLGKFCALILIQCSVSKCWCRSSTDKDSIDSGEKKPEQSAEHAPKFGSHHIMDLAAATFLDVGVLRCLFITDWQEEGIYWALHFLYNR